MPLSKLKMKLSDSSSSSVSNEQQQQQQQSSTSSSNGGESTGDNDDNLEDIDEVDDQGQNILMGIISQLRPGCDLSRITLPTFILERKSMLERITNQLQQPDIILEAKNSKDPLQRFLLVVKWYLSGWHIAPKAVKKPLNPVLGEFFTSYWDLPNNEGQAYYISEQTSHHPPKSSYFYMIPNHNIRVDGACIPKSKFLGNSTAAMMDGITICQFLDLLDDDGNPEKYTLTQPNMYARGILFGKMKLELGDHMIIKCPTTGYSVDIEFKTKGFIGGSYDSIEGIVKNLKGSSLFEISGKWNEIIYIKDLGKKINSKSIFFDTTKAKPLSPKVRPLNEQGEFESRKLWKKVTDALGDRNHEIATDEKFKIEDSQRILSKKRLEDGVEFHPKLFKKSSNPDSELEYILYKNIPNDATPEEKTKLILETAPILPGQNFTPEFDIPAYQKLHNEGQS